MTPAYFAAVATLALALFLLRRDPDATAAVGTMGLLYLFVHITTS